MFQEKRFKEFVSKKKQIVELCREVDRNPQSDFECEVLCEEDNTFLLSTENMKSLKVLLTEVNKKIHNSCNQFLIKHSEDKKDFTVTTYVVCIY